MVTEDDDPVKLQELVESWRGKTRVRVLGVKPFSFESLHLDPRAYPCGYNPVYQFLNVGVSSASEPWVMVPAGDDSYFPPGWETLLEAVDLAGKLREIWVPRYFSVQAGDVKPPVIRPCEYTMISPHPVSETELLPLIDGWRSSERVRESAGTRERVSWVHAVIHKDLFDRVGGYRTNPPYSDAHDLHLNDDLRDRFGVTSVGVHTSVIVNARAGVNLGA